MRNEIARFIGHKIQWINQSGQGTPALLATLRRGIGRMPGDDPALWPIIFEDMPDEMLSISGTPTRAEWAVHTALTLYALHQQGMDPSLSPMHVERTRLGQALNRLAGDDDEATKRIKRRFDTMATADRMPETVYHLRSLVQLLRAQDIPLDYEALGRDLYLLQSPSQAPGVRLRWGQDFYRKHKDATNEQGGNE